MSRLSHLQTPDPSLEENLGLLIGIRRREDIHTCGLHLLDSRLQNHAILDSKAFRDLPLSRPRGQSASPRVTSIMRVHISMASHITRTGNAPLSVRKRFVSRLQAPVDRRFVGCTGTCVFCGKASIATFARSELSPPKHLLVVLFRPLRIRRVERVRDVSRVAS